jgi:hypothetical protein
MSESEFPAKAPHSTVNLDKGGAFSWLRPDLVGSWWEVAGVAASFVGYFSVTSLRQALRGSGSRYIALLLSDYHLLINIAIESVFLAAFFGFLHYRGWKKSDFKIKPGWWSSLQGILLLIQLNWETPAQFSEFSR